MPWKYRGCYWVNRQKELLTGGGRGCEKWWSWRIITSRRWRASCNIPHTWCWRNKFCFLDGLNSIYLSDVWIVAIIFSHRWHSNIGLHSEWLLQPPCTVLLMWLEMSMDICIFERSQLGYFLKRPRVGWIPELWLYNNKSHIHSLPKLLVETV